MTNNKHKEQILSSLSNIVCEIEKIVNEYLNSFDTDSSFSFSDKEDKQKEFLKAYKKFSVALQSRMEQCEQAAGMISALICEADNSNEKELAEILSVHFNNYVQFSFGVFHFIEMSEKVFLDKGNGSHPIVIVSYTRELLATIQNYKENI